MQLEPSDFSVKSQVENLNGVADAGSFFNAIEFLKCWEPDGPWTLIAILPDAQPPKIDARTFQPTEADEARHWITVRQRGERNIYFSINRVKPESFGRKATKEMIAEIVATHADIDLVGARNDDEEQAILDKLRSRRSQPTAIIFSGGGYQALWRFHDPLKADEDRNVDRVETVNKRLIAELDGDAKCFNIDRIFRLPGTVNYPNEKKRAKGRVPTLSYLVEADWDRRITPALPAIDEQKVSDHVGEDQAQGDDPVGEATPFEDLPQWLRDAITTGETTNSGDDGSDAVFAVACGLVREGWTAAAIETVLLDPTLGISAHPRRQARPNRAARRAIAKARAADAPQAEGAAWFHEEGDWAGAPRGLAEIIERDGYFTGDHLSDLFLDLCAWLKVRVGEKSWTMAARAYNRRYFRPPLSPKDAYDVIRRFNKTRGDTGVDILPDTIEISRRLQMIHGDPTCWRITIDGTTVILDDITSQTEFRKKLARAKIIAPRMKAKAYDTMIQQLLDDCEEIGGNASAMRAGLIKGRVSRAPYELSAARNCTRDE
jgi:RepB DNA-primase from phage plasmid